MAHFTTVEAARLVGASYRQVNHWLTKMGTSPGTGNHLLLEEADVVRLGIVHSLRKLGVTVDRAVACASRFRDGDSSLTMAWDDEMELTVRVSEIRDRLRVNAAKAAKAAKPKDKALRPAVTSR